MKQYTLLFAVLPWIIMCAPETDSPHKRYSEPTLTEEKHRLKRSFSLRDIIKPRSPRISPQDIPLEKPLSYTPLHTTIHVRPYDTQQENNLNYIEEENNNDSIIDITTSSSDPITPRISSSRSEKFIINSINSLVTKNNNIQKNIDALKNTLNDLQQHMKKVDDLPTAKMRVQKRDFLNRQMEANQKKLLMLRSQQSSIYTKSYTSLMNTIIKRYGQHSEIPYGIMTSLHEVIPLIPDGNIKDHIIIESLANKNIQSDSSINTMITFINSSSITLKSKAELEQTKLPQIKTEQDLETIKRELHSLEEFSKILHKKYGVILPFETLLEKNIYFYRCSLLPVIEPKYLISFMKEYKLTFKNKFTLEGIQRYIAQKENTLFSLKELRTHISNLNLQEYFANPADKNILLDAIDWNINRLSKTESTSLLLKKAREVDIH